MTTLEPNTGLSCQACGSRKSKVIDSRARSRTKSKTYFDYIRRRRKCLKCGHRVTTYETDRKIKNNTYTENERILALVKKLLREL